MTSDTLAPFQAIAGCEGQGDNGANPFEWDEFGATGPQLSPGGVTLPLFFKQPIALHPGCTVSMAVSIAAS